VACVTTLTYASTNHQWARPACPLVRSSKTKPCQFSSVTPLTYVHAFSSTHSCSFLVKPYSSCFSTKSLQKITNGSIKRWRTGLLCT